MSVVREVLDRRPDARRVIGGEIGRVNPVARAVDRHVGDGQLDEAMIALDVAVQVGVAAGDEDDAGNLVIDEGAHVVGLGRGAGGLRADDRNPVRPRDLGLEEVGVGREDRVGQFGNDDSDDGVLRGAHGRGALVAEGVDGDEDTMARLVRDLAGAVDDAGHGRNGHLRVLGDVRHACA